MNAHVKTILVLLVLIIIPYFIGLILNEGSGLFGHWIAGLVAGVGFLVFIFVIALIYSEIYDVFK